MFVIKVNFDVDNREVVDLIKTEIENKCQVNVLDSKGLFGSEAIVLAIIAATPGIITTIATVVQTYLKHNEGKSVTIENSKGKRTYTGYSMEEIKEFERFLNEDIKVILI